ncbi:MAG: protein kinase domain-containing protein [Myxococcaceae bacterium]
MPCPDANAVYQFLRGGLDSQERLSLESHIDGCADCRQLISHLASSEGPGQPRGPLGAEPPTLDESGAPFPNRRSLEDRVLPAGTAIGRYRLGRQVGSGSMGSVYVARDPELDREVAIKVLHPALVGDGAARARFLREAQAMARLSHPNVISIFDAGPFGDGIFLAMEYVDGETLSDWLALPRPPSEILERFLAAGQGLLAAHQRGLLHRDFKPDNVLVGRDGTVRVTDFGLARATAAPSQEAVTEPDSGSGGRRALDAPLTRTGEFLGTPRFMAPEQFLSGPTDARADQFSFCVALYAALYGEHPFPGDSVTNLAVAVMTGKVRPPPAGAKVRASLRRVLLRGLRHRPEERYPSMESLLEDLVAEPRRHRTRRIAAMALAGALGLGGMVAAALALGAR